MKSVKFLVVAISLTIQTVAGQARLGLVGGLHFSEADQVRFFDAGASQSMKYVLGGIFDYTLTRNLTLLAMPTYSEKGTSALLMSSDGMGGRLYFDLCYLELPLLLKYSIGNDLRPHVVIGPTIGINLSSRLRAELRDPKLGQLQIETSAREIVRDLEYSVEVGCGLSYELDAILTVFLQARYTRGVNNVARNGSVRTTLHGEVVEKRLHDEPVYRNKGLRILVGFEFPLQINGKEPPEELNP